MQSKERPGANDPGMSRRTLLVAAPALALAGGTQAAANTVTPQSETPVATLFRTWKAHNEWLNSEATDHIPDEEVDALCDRDMEMIDTLVSTPARNMEDLCLKLLVVTDFGALISYAKLTGAELLKQEANALIGGAA